MLAMGAKRSQKAGGRKAAAGDVAEMDGGDQSARARTGVCHAWGDPMDAREAGPGLPHGDAADEMPDRVRVLEVHAWVGPLDAAGLNREILRIMREDFKKQDIKEAELSRRYQIKRQHLHKLHHLPTMTLTLPMAARWCNARRVDVAYLVALAALSLRRRCGAA